MLGQLNARIMAHFATLSVAQKGPALLHPLLDIVAIALCSVCGADVRQEMELCGQAKHDWLKRFRHSRMAFPRMTASAAFSSVWPQRSSVPALRGGPKPRRT